MLANLCSDRLSSRLPFYYGYVMIPVAMMMQVCTSPGQTFAISAFTSAIRDTLELSDSRLSFAYMLGTFLAAFPLSLIGPLADRWGLRVVSVFVATALSLTCWFASHINGFSTLLLAFFLLRFLGQGSLSLLSGHSISMWFRTRIGRVSAAMSVGSAIAFAWVPEWIHLSIESRGWRSTYVAIAAIIAAVILPMLFLLFRNKPEDINQQVDGLRNEDGSSSVKVASSAAIEPGVVETVISEPAITLSDAIRQRSFYILAVINSLWALAGTGVVFYLFTLCEDRGLAANVSTDLFKTLGLSMLAAQLTGGILADKFPLHRLLGAGTFMLATGMALAAVGDTALKMHGFAAFFGAGQGTVLAVGSVIWVRYYGRLHLGSIRGTVWSFTVAGSGCGPFVMGVARDHFGSFDHAIELFMLAMCSLAVAAWWATPPMQEPVQ